VQISYQESAMVQHKKGPTLADLRAKRHEILRIAAARGVRNVRVFGSVAKNEAQSTSDIDFLVDMEHGRSVLDLSELILDLEEIFGRSVHVVTIRRPSELAEAIEREAILL
jgi:uncharacterized protein